MSGTIIFQKYKNVGLDNHRSIISKYNCPFLILGQKHVGKKTLVNFTYKNAIFCTVDLIPENINAYFYNVICISDIDKLSTNLQKKLCSYLDKYVKFALFIFTSRTANLIHELKSRLLIYRLLPPRLDEIEQNIEKILLEEKIFVTNKHNFKGKTYHTILIELTLFSYNKSINILNSNNNLYEDLAKNLQVLDFVAIRKKLYILFLKQYNMHKLIHDIVIKLLDIHDDFELKLFIIKNAAYYEHQMCLGNKDIYHVEAFLFAVKNRIFTNIK